MLFSDWNKISVLQAYPVRITAKQDPMEPGSSGAPDFEFRRQERIRIICAQAGKLPPEQRPAFLEEACAGETELRAAVERLLNDEASTVSLAPAQSLVGIQEIRNRWRDCVAEATTIIVIGVRPNPEDHHVWDPIAANPSARGFYIGSRSQLEAWPEASTKLRFLEETFEAGLPRWAASL
jgi:hypothetical protein